MAQPTQPVSINGVEFDALFDETHSFEADVPAYPVETGFEVQDTIILKPQSLSMTLFLTNSPITWKEKAGPSHVQDVMKQLEGLYFAKTPVTVSTSERTYKDMAITSLEFTKNLQTGTSREVSITLQEIRYTEAQTTTLPDSYGRSGATGASAGTANTTSSSAPGTPAESADPKTIIIGLANMTGVFN